MCVDASPLTAELPADCEQSQTPSHLAGSWLDLREGHRADAADIYWKKIIILIKKLMPKLNHILYVVIFLKP